MNDERHGIEALRVAVEAVATEIERRPRSGLRGRGVRWRVLAAAAALVLAVLGWMVLRPAGSPEVEVVGMKIRGRAVPARIVEGAAPGTILVMPDRQRPEAATATAVAVWRTR